MALPPGIDITDILRLRHLAADLDWYRARMASRNNLVRAGIAGALAVDARTEADELAFGLGLGAIPAK